MFLSYKRQTPPAFTQGPSPKLHTLLGQKSTGPVVVVVVAVVVVVVDTEVVVISAHRSKLSGHVVPFTYMRQTLKLLMQGPTPKRHAFTPVQNSSVELMVVVVTVVVTIRQSTSVFKQLFVSPFGW